jgi:hypothetical protein
VCFRCERESFEEIDFLQCMAMGYGDFETLGTACLFVVVADFSGCFVRLMAVCMICPLLLLEVLAWLES